MTYKRIAEFKNRARSFLPEERLKIINYDPIMRTQGFQDVERIFSEEFKSSILVAYVKSTEEISALLRLSQELLTPISVRQASGSNTLDIPRKENLDSVVIDLRDMNNIELDIDNGYVEIGPAVTFVELNKYLSKYGYSYPSSVAPVTWSSLVGLNTSGQLIEGYTGKPGDYVIGMQVVIPGGEVLELGSKTIRKPCGPDLSRLFIGGQALFGIITMLRLMLVRKPNEIKYGIAVFQSIDQIGEAVMETYKGGSPFARIFDFMDDRYLKLLGIHEEFNGSLVMLEIDGDAPGSSTWKLNSIFDVFKKVGNVETKAMETDEWSRLSTIRYGHQEYLRKQKKLLLMGEVIDCPISKLTKILVETKKLQTDLCKEIEGLNGYYFGHIGALSFHPAFSAPIEWPYEKHKNVTIEIRKKLLEIKIKHQASVSEQGIFPEHKDWYLQTYGEKNFELLCKIKAIFDPFDIYNSERL